MDEICGFILADNQVCTAPGPRCEIHRQARYAVCTGCGNDATRACTARLPGGSPCDMGLCPACMHLPEERGHGPIERSDVTGGSTAVVFAEIRRDITSVIARVLAEQVPRGTVKFTDAEAVKQVAEAVLDGLGVHLTVLNVSALARHAQAEWQR